MQYIIYIDKVWLMDFVLSTYLLFLVRQACGLKNSFLRLTAASAAGASLFIVILLLPGAGFLTKLFLQAVCVNPLLLKAAFSFRTKEMVVKAYICMNGCGILLGGMVACLSGYLPGMRSKPDLWRVLLVSTVAAALVSLCLYIGRKRKRGGRLYAVKLDFYGEMLMCRGLADSGNSLYEPYGRRPVCVLDGQAAGGLLEKVPPEKRYLVPFHSIGKRHGLLFAVELPCMEVDDGEEKRVFQKVVVALSDEPLTGKTEYQMLLHPEFVRQEE